jgi:hypothetical protein
MRAIQASDGVLTNRYRQVANVEFQQLKNELDRLAAPPTTTASIFSMAAARRSGHVPSRLAENRVKSADGDALDLSLSARVSELSSQMAAGLSDPPADLMPERMGQIQSRIGSGFYNQSETAGATADQLLSFYGR